MTYHSRPSRNDKIKNIAVALFVLAVIGIAIYIVYLIIASPAQSYL